MPTLAVHIGRHLRAARENTGLTQAEAARRAGLSAPTLGSCERGSATPTVRKAFALADVYGITLNELLGYPYPAPKEGA